MAKAYPEIIEALRKTAAHLQKSQHYQWGHMGACNCGFLCQQVTKLRPDEIHRRALQGYGDWNEQLNDYCPTSGLPFDEIISELLAFGFDIDDLKHLERLSDERVLSALDGRHLSKNCREDVIVYLSMWSDLLEKEFLGRVALPEGLLHPTPSGVETR